MLCHVSEYVASIAWKRVFATRIKSVLVRLACLRQSSRGRLTPYKISLWFKFSKIYFIGSTAHKNYRSVAVRKRSTRVKFSRFSVGLGSNLKALSPRIKTIQNWI